MKIVIALDSFKGSCSAQAACAAVAQGLRRVDEALELVEMPVSDGGEGLLDPCGKSAAEGREVAAAALYLALRSLRTGRVSDPARRAGHY
jgi:glycerate kinase